MESVHEARDAIGQWVAAAEARSELESSPELQQLRLGYDGQGQEGYRVPPNEVDHAKVVATELEEINSSRLALASVTLSAGGRG